MTAPAAPLVFHARPACPVCGATSGRTIWSGRLTDAQIAAHLDRFFYSGDWRAALPNAEFALKECAGCAMKWHHHVLDDAGLAVLYGAWADAEQARRFEAAHVPDKADSFAQATQMTKLILRLRHLTTPGTQPRLLDFGCGDGKFLRVARALGLEAVGIDISASRTADIRAEGLEILPDLDALDAAGHGAFDAIVLSQVLEHVTDPRGLLQALVARLGCGGVLFVAVPDTSGVAVPGDFHQFTLVQPLEHINAFAPGSLRELGRRVGLRAIRRPVAFMTTTPRAALRTALNWVWQPASTDVFFRKPIARDARPHRVQT